MIRLAKLEQEIELIKKNFYYIPKIYIRIGIWVKQGVTK